MMQQVERLPRSTKNPGSFLTLDAVSVEFAFSL